FLLSCLVVIIGSLVWTVSARQDFESKKERVIQFYQNATSDSIGNSKVVFLVEFLEKYGKQIQLTAELQSEAEFLVQKYNEEKTKQPLVEGAPPQGGWITKLLKDLAIKLGVALVEEIKKGARS
ncbi:hypothetical protein KR059_006559, partial [Drosophila kikkawai]